MVTCFGQLGQIDYGITNGQIQGVIPTATPPIGSTPNSIRFKIKRVGTTNGTIYCRVWNSAADVPGSPSGTYGSMDASTLGTSYDVYTFSSAAVALTATSHIGIEADITGGGAIWLEGQLNDVANGYWWYYDGSINSRSPNTPNFCYGEPAPTSTTTRLPPPPIVLSGL